jgi:hypothetical protein
MVVAAVQDVSRCKSQAAVVTSNMKSVHSLSKCIDANHSYKCTLEVGGGDGARAGVSLCNAVSVT